MEWTWEAIKRDWLGEGRIAIPPEAAVEAFNRVESVLGFEWMARCRGSTGTTSGPHPALCVVNMGQQLEILDGVSGTDTLIGKIREGNASASAELTAIFLIKSGRPDARVELEPEGLIPGRNKKPDFRISGSAAEWIIVEVTQPDLSEEAGEAMNVLQELSGSIKDIKHSYSVEVFLRRIPSDEELSRIKARLPIFCVKDGVHREDLGDLGFLFLNLDPPGHVNLRHHEGEDIRPRIGQACCIVGPTEPHRHINVRLAFSDQRAQQFLESEAKQLPRDASGLIMVQMANAFGGSETWEAILRRRLQPKLHTRVSAICLFHSGIELDTDGEAWILRTKLILNPHANYSLPDWVVQQLARFAPLR